MTRLLTSPIRRILSVIVAVTGGQENWAEVAEAAADRFAAQHRVEAFWTTSGPLRSILIGRNLTRLLRVPWVADLRDAVSRITTVQTKSTILSYLARRRYGRLLGKARAVVVVSPQEQIRDSRWLSSPVISLPSGFDPALWQHIHANSPGSEGSSDAFSIVYTGSIAIRHRPSLFFEGLRRYISQSDGMVEVQVDYYGPTGDRFMEAARQAGVIHTVRDHGVVASDAARKAMAEADVLLLLTYPGVSGIPGGKLYDYLASTSPILAVPAGDAYVAQVLTDSAAGTEASTPDEISSALHLMMKAPKGDRDAIFAERVKAHEWEERSKRLARILDDVSK